MNKDLVIEKEEELRLAMLNSDVEALGSLLHDSLRFALPSGDLMGKAEDIESHQQKVINFSELNCNSVEVQVFNNFAVTFSNMDLEGTFGEDSIDGNYSYMRVWAPFDGHLQVVSGNVCII